MDRDQLVQSIRLSDKETVNQLLIKYPKFIGYEIEPSKDTPLHLAVYCPPPEKCNIESLPEMLLKFKADPSITNKYGDNVAHVSSMQPHAIYYLKLLLSYQHESICTLTNDSNETILHLATYSGYHDNAKFILETFPNLVNEKNIQGNTPLHIACYYDDIKLIKLLIDFGHASLENCNELDESPIHVAASRGNIEIFNLLLDKLIQSQDLFEKVDKCGTILLVAAEFQQVEIILSLLSTIEVKLSDQYVKKAVNIQDKEGKSLLHKLCKDKPPSELKRSIPEEIFHRTNIHSLVQNLIDKNADVNISCYKQTTALFAAVKSQQIELTTLLLKNNISPNSVDIYRCTALHMASELNDIKIIRLLVNA